MDRSDLISYYNDTKFLHIDKVGQSVWISFFKMPINKVNMEASTASNDICIYFAYKDNNLLP